MTPAFVLDSSVTLAWCFPDEATDATRTLLRRMGNEVVTVPPLWFSEVANALAVAERRERIRADQTAEFIRLLSRFDLLVDEHAEHHAFTYGLELARTYRLSVNDATYLELARRTRLPLATLDLSLRVAAEQTGVVLLGI